MLLNNRLAHIPHNQYADSWNVRTYAKFAGKNNFLEISIPSLRRSLPAEWMNCNSAWHHLNIEKRRLEDEGRLKTTKKNRNSCGLTLKGVAVLPNEEISVPSFEKGIKILENENGSIRCTIDRGKDYLQEDTSGMLYQFGPLCATFEGTTSGGTLQITRIEKQTIGLAFLGHFDLLWWQPKTFHCVHALRMVVKRQRKDDAAFEFFLNTKNDRAFSEPMIGPKNSLIWKTTNYQID